MGDPFKVVTVMMVLGLLRVTETVIMVVVELVIMMLQTEEVIIFLKGIIIIEVVVIVIQHIRIVPLFLGCLSHVSMFLSCRLQACCF